jgi:hypothetical protein
MRLNLPYLRCDTDRHGNERLFVRRFGRCIRIRALPSTKGFGEAYSAALEALEAGAPQVHAPRGAAPAGTLGWLAAAYFAAVEFTGLPAVSQSTRRGIIELSVVFPRLVWDSFGAWLRTIRPGIPPSDVGNVVRQTIPEFLVNCAKTNSLAEFITDRQDTDNMRVFRLVS